MSELFRYLGVGIINFLACALSMWGLALIGIHYTIYTAIGYALAITCSFFLNLKFTFKDSIYSKRRFIRFVGFSFCNLMLVEIIQWTLIQQMHARELYAVITGMTWYTLSGFIINKFFVYQSYEKEHRYMR